MQTLILDVTNTMTLQLCSATDRTLIQIRLLGKPCLIAWIYNQPNFKLPFSSGVIIIVPQTIMHSLVSTVKSVAVLIAIRIRGQLLEIQGSLQSLSAQVHVLAMAALNVVELVEALLIE